MSFASICVLSYERPEFLTSLLEGLFKNSGAPLELIIHDDGSQNQDVRDVLSVYARVAKVITNPPGHNEGQGTALNRMFNMAQGDPIVKMDQDLTLLPGWLQDVNRILADDDEACIGLLGLCHYFADPVDMRKTLIDRHNGWQEHTHILGSAFAVRRETWEELGPFPEHSDAFAEDWEFQQRVTASDYYCCALPDEALAINSNMGPGPSTIVSGTPGNYEVAKIHHGPLVHGENS